MEKKQISRRDFIRGAAGAMGMAAVTTLTGLSVKAEQEKGTYIPGTYSATANGMGTVTVTMTFDAESITDVVLDVSGETPDIGQKAADTLIEQILSTQGADIDGVSGATVTSTAVKVAAEACIAQAKGEAVVVKEEAPSGGSSLDLSFMDKPEPIDPVPFPHVPPSLPISTVTRRARWESAM